METSTPATSASAVAQPLRILVINPNTSEAMTASLSPVLNSLAYPPGFIQYTFFTSPSSTASSEDNTATQGIPSINSPGDAAVSAQVCLPHLLPLIPHHDAFLVACYSQHPLVSLLKSACGEFTRGAGARGAGVGVRKKYVTGIFEASVLASLALLDNGDGSVNLGEKGIANETFGIVSTGAIWESALTVAVEGFLGAKSSQRFAGVETTGLNASELHDLPAEEVRAKMVDATRRLLRRGGGVGGESRGAGGGVKAICLGCAGMAGLDDAVREACVLELGEERGREVSIVDGVKAGVGVLIGLAAAGF